MPVPLSYEMVRTMMAEAGVDAAVLVPPSWEGDRNDYCLEAAKAYPNQFAVMGRLPVTDPKSKAALQHWIEPGMLGVRLTLHHATDQAWMREGKLDWFWPEVERLNIPVMVHAPTLKDELGVVAARHPGLRLIIDHMGLGREHMDDAMGPAVARTITLAKFPNVFCKVSAAPSFSSEPYPRRNTFEPIKRVIEAFGVKRCFWGTDLSHLPGTFREALTMFTEEMDFLSADDLEWIMGRAISECLGWPKILNKVP